MKAEAAPRRILVLSVAGLGDFVLGTPALRALRHSFPRTQVYILTIPEVVPLAERCPYVDEVRTLDLRRSRSALVWLLGPRWREVFSLIRQLRALRFDVAVLLRGATTRLGGLRLEAFLWAVGPKRIVGRSPRRFGLHLDPTRVETRHEIEAQLEAVQHLGVTSVGDLPELWVTTTDRAACTALLATHGIGPGQPLACLHPGSARPEKCWPAERFAVVGRRLAEAGARVVLIGSTGECAIGRPLAETIPGAICLVGETSLPVLSALLERAALLVTNDSGPMHMAAALGTPAVVAFGPGSPARFGPRTRGICRIFAGIQGPGGAPWWEGISAEAVSEAAIHLLVEGSACFRVPRSDG